MSLTIEELRAKYEMVKETKEIIYCAIEEMSEVTKVLTKFLRQSSKFSVDDLEEEIAHSLLMLDVVKTRFGIRDYRILLRQALALEKALKEGL